MTYALVDVVFLSLACVALACLGLPASWRPLFAAGTALMALTAVFDSVMIGLGLFGYRASTLSGIFVGLAPVEDFAYPLAAAVVLPALWRRLRPAPSTRRPAPSTRRPAPSTRKPAPSSRKGDA
ncbi:lycopene cyclase domain-containing protein [Sinomonas humi]|uniref:lycopene cyclase domain-containing protein n=1 Tax=Sinomonas humi TaxID=1338436 RepID=UPI0009DCA973|nr:lycopene cyclase domain-containing protein [Sinomonas humi]